jgi:uncharacterized protein YceK
MKKMLKTVLTVSLMAVLALDMQGCASIQKKFTRKKKTEAKPIIIIYSRTTRWCRPWSFTPTLHLLEELAPEIIATLGKNSKKDLRCITEMVGNLQDMQRILTDEKAAELEPHIKVLQKIEEEVRSGNMTMGTKTQIMRRLEKEYALIKMGYSYNKVGPYIRETFAPLDEEQLEGKADADQEI